MIKSISAVSVVSATRKYVHEIKWGWGEDGYLALQQIAPHFIALEKDMAMYPRAIWNVEKITDERQAQIAKSQGRDVFRIDEYGGYQRI